MKTQDIQSACRAADPYTYHAEFDVDVYVAHVDEFPELMALGDTSTEAVDALKCAVSAHLVGMARAGEAPPAPKRGDT